MSVHSSTLRYKPDFCGI